MKMCKHVFGFMREAIQMRSVNCKPVLLHIFKKLLIVKDEKPPGGLFDAMAIRLVGSHGRKVLPREDDIPAEICQNFN